MAKDWVSYDCFSICYYFRKIYHVLMSYRPMFDKMNLKMYTFLNDPTKFQRINSDPTHSGHGGGIREKIKYLK